MEKWNFFVNTGYIQTVAVEEVFRYSVEYKYSINVLHLKFSRESSAVTDILNMFNKVH